MKYIFICLYQWICYCGVDISGHVSSMFIAAETALEFSIALISLHATTYM